jgi:AAA15 family ATPase/GTPase
MLIEFSLANYRSFAKEQTLSLTASKLKDTHENRVTQLRGNHPLEVLTAAMLLGKNGSGKSTLVNAMGFVRRFVRDSSKQSQHGELIDVGSNKLDRDLDGQDTSFRILFSMHDVVYEFAFSLNSERVTKEVLTVADRTTRFRRLYERTYDPKNDAYEYFFSEDLKGDKAVWRSATRENALFLSTAVQLNAESLREPFSWLSNYMRTLDATTSTPTYTANACMNTEHKSRVLKFLKRLDINIADIVVEDDDFDESTLSQMFTPDFLKQLPISPTEWKNMRKTVRFVHKDSRDAPVELDISEESAGTRALFGLAGPVFDTLANGYCLIIDEVNTNLHPLVFHALVDAFSDPSLNTKRAQLIFTSHDTTLLRDSYFRRDQVWFVDTDRLGRSSLVPLSDYSPRKGEALERGYLGGRYGGVPYVGPPVAPASEQECLTAE